ncbi:hypothetical protein RYX36_025152 [Vicia faba]
MSSSPYLTLLFIYYFTYPTLSSDPGATKVLLLCTNKTATSMPFRKLFISNFLSAMDSLTPLIAKQQYAAVSNGARNATVFAYGECIKDLSQSDCNICIAQCKTQILSCLPFQKGTRGGRLLFDGCYIRYDEYSFFNESLGNQDTTVCGNNETKTSSNVYEANVYELLRNLSVLAPKNGGFSVGFVERKNVTVYGLAQCWKFVTGGNCRRCLEDAVTRIGSSCRKKEDGRALNSGCYLRHSPHKFYNNSSSNDVAAGNRGHRKMAIILAASSAVLALLLVTATMGFFIRKNVMRKRRERKQFGTLLDTVNKSKLNVPYEILEKATNYFNDDNKLGQGGSGSVYKGVMPDGNTVAVKRLSFNSTQWVDHFFNEVNLISGVHHKNLVKLLGCSITGPESLLVYEYVPNQSLYDYLSVRRICQPLSWEVRHKIILGIAEGLAYLHEESHHGCRWDTVSARIILFCTLLCFVYFYGSYTHFLFMLFMFRGYMAPEYVIRGKLTEKADVYSFGVLVVEIVSGKKNSSYVLNSSSILQTVWNLYGSDKLSDIVDPILEGNFPEEEACQMLRIGLLCAQATAELRPSMSVVVKMINNNHEIPQPTQPPFIYSSSSELSKSASQRRCNFLPQSNTQSSGDTMTESLVDPR